MVRAGILNEIITIEELKVIKNEYGEEQTDNYVKKFNCRACVRWNNGNRITDNNELFFAYDVTFTVRYYNDITELDRVIWNGEKYRILSIEKDREWQQIRLRCELINE